MEDLLEAISKLMQLTVQDIRIVSALMTNFIERYPAPAAVPVVPIPVVLVAPVPEAPQNQPQLHQKQEINHGHAEVSNQAAQNEPIDVDVKPDVEMVVVVPEPVPRPIPEPKRSRTKPKTIGLGMIKYSNRYPADVKRHAIRLRDKGKSFPKITNKIGRLYPKYGFPSIGSVQKWIKERARWLDLDSSAVAVNVNVNDSVAATSAADSNEVDSALPRKIENETQQDQQ